MVDRGIDPERRMCAYGDRGLMSVPYQHGGKQRRNEPREKTERRIPSFPDRNDPAVWTMQRVRLADGTEFSAATRQARAKETEAEKRERLRAERREMAEALRRHRLSKDNIRKG